MEVLKINKRPLLECPCDVSTVVLEYSNRVQTQNFALLLSDKTLTGSNLDMMVEWVNEWVAEDKELSEQYQVKTGVEAKRW